MLLVLAAVFESSSPTASKKANGVTGSSSGPIRPASLRLNGKVECSQRTDLEEFYPTVDLKSPDLSQQLQDWEDHYYQYRTHGALQGHTP